MPVLVFGAGWSELSRHLFSVGLIFICVCNIFFYLCMLFLLWCTRNGRCMKIKFIQFTSFWEWILINFLLAKMNRLCNCWYMFVVFVKEEYLNSVTGCLLRLHIMLICLLNGMLQEFRYANFFSICFWLAFSLCRQCVRHLNECALTNSLNFSLLRFCG